MVPQLYKCSCRHGDANELVAPAYALHLVISQWFDDSDTLYCNAHVVADTVMPSS